MSAPRARTLFDDLAARRGRTTVHLSRPFDIAPDGGTAYDLSRLATLVGEAAGWLRAAGVRAGDRVAIAKPNHWDYDLLAYAAARIGAVPAKLSARLPVEALQTLLKRLDPALLVTTGAVLAGAGDAGCDLTSFSRRTLCLDGPGDSAGGGGQRGNVVDLASVRGHAPASPWAGGHDDEPVVIVHTSGTTGLPKLVTHTHRTMMRQLAGLESVRLPVLACRRADVAATASAYAHGRTFCWTATVCAAGAGTVLVLADHDPDLAGPSLRAHRPTVIEALPATFVRWMTLLDTADHPFRDTRMFVSTYDAMHPPTIRAYLSATGRRHPIWLQGWGQSETGPLTFRFFGRRALRPTAGRHPTTRDVGRPVPGRTALRVVDPETFAPVPRGRPGLVLARTKALCLGYVGERDRFRAKDNGGWFNTGDIGVRTRDGRLLLIDREIDRIPGASCIELEDVIDDRIAAVVECVILGVPGRRPLPVVVTADGTLDPGGWRAAVSDLPPLADPVVLRWAEVPRTGTGKVRRAELRARLLDTADTFGSGRWT